MSNPMSYGVIGASSLVNAGFNPMNQAMGGAAPYD